MYWYRIRLSKGMGHTMVYASGYYTYFGELNLYRRLLFWRRETVATFQPREWDSVVQEDSRG